MEVSPNSAPFTTVFGEIKMSGARARSDFLCFRETLINRFLNSRLLLGTKQAALNAPADGIEQFKPIIQRWFIDGLPLLEPAVAHEKLPSVADVLGINLHALSVFSATLPTDFRFARHGQSARSTPATAMAAMPSSRPTNPRCSLVVALMPTRLMCSPSAAATLIFISLMCGASLGCWAMIVASTFTMRASRNLAWRAASSRKTLLATPCQRGSVLGKK